MKQQTKAKVRQKIKEFLKASHGQEQINYQKLHNDKDILRLLQGSSHEKNVAIFSRFIRDICERNEKLKCQATGVRWNKKYPKIVDIKTLQKQIEQRKQGILVQEQLLQFTYKNVKNDIEKILKKSNFKKIMSSNKNDYYIFYHHQKDFDEVTPNMHFGKNFYLELCKKTVFIKNTKEQDNDTKQQGKIINSKSWNSWVDGYKELKEKWIKNLK